MNPVSFLFIYAMESLVLFNMPVQITGIEQAKGQLLITVYRTAADFMQVEKAVYKAAYPVGQSGAVSVNIQQLPAGEYAIACFHDLNGNGILDKNLVGIPVEPYGFSQGARPRFRAPTWEEARFYFSGQAVSLSLEKW